MLDDKVVCNLFESCLWDVFDVDPDVDNCWTLGRQFELNVVLRHTDALCLEKERRSSVFSFTQHKC